ncbi:MAG: EAL domain-containing protein [Chloroflexota bacterium]
MRIIIFGHALLSIGRIALIILALGGEDQKQLDKLMSMALTGLTALAAAFAARQTAREGSSRAWALLACGAVANFCGDSLYLLVGITSGDTPFPSIADAAYLLYYPFILAGLLAFPHRPESASERLKFWLDALTTLVGGGLLFWYFLIFPIADSQETSDLAAFVAVAYPVADLVLILGVASVALRASVSLSRTMFGLLGGSIVAFLIADVAYGNLNLTGQYVAGEPITLLAEAPYQISYLLLSVAAFLAVRRAARRDRPSSQVPDRLPAVNSLPYVAVLVGYSLLVWASFGDVSNGLRGLIVGAVLMTGLVLARQIAAVRENSRLLTEHVARRTEARFRSLVQHASDVITVIDAAGYITFQSDSVARIFGYTPHQLTGLRFIDLVHADDRDRAREFLQERLRSADVASGIEWRLRHSDGRWRQVFTVVASLVDDPDVNGIVLTSRDDTERFNLAEQLRHQAFHDALTGLANRALFENRLDHALARAARNGSAVAVMFLDLDHFKTINDSLGHAAGDTVLTVLGQRLRRIVRESDTLARFGGDEFAILLDDGVSGDRCVAIAERCIHACREPILIHDREVTTGCSIGIALSESGLNAAAEIMRDADLAMYSGKTNGRGRYEIYEPTMHARVVEQLELEADLRGAIEREEFVVHYQPIIALESGQITGVEALVRWQHPTRGLLAPAAFIPRAEETGLIVPIGFQVLRRACLDAKAWHLDVPGDHPLRVSINLSIRQLEHSGCFEEVASAIRDSQVDPSSIVLEVTESFMMRDPRSAIDRLHELKTLGVHVALDDFGTGFSSLSYLQQMCVDIIKIDRAFVNGMLTSDRDASLVDAIMALGASLKLEIVAEGIELAEQADRLRQLGCHYGQGYFLGRPREHQIISALLVEQFARQLGLELLPHPANTVVKAVA